MTRHLGLLCLSLLPSTVVAQGSFTRGDANSDCTIDISDAVFTLGWLFLGDPAPICADAADYNDDGTINIGDPVATLGHLFRGDSRPAAPFPLADTDPTNDSLSCSGWALHFSDVEFMEVFDSPTLEFQDGLSVGCWIYLDRQKPRHRFFFKAGGAENLLFEVRYRNGEGGELPDDPYPRLKLYVAPGFPADGVRGTSEVPVRQWVHVAATVGAGVARLYLNGLLDAELQVSEEIAQGSNSLLVGTTPGQPASAGLEGMLDRLAVFNRSLSGDEVEELMLGRLGRGAAGLVGLYSFDECGTANPQDASGLNNHGRLGFASAPDVADPQRVPSDTPLAR